jgi:holo-[acyl-carrier protein] synthase
MTAALVGIDVVDAGRISAAVTGSGGVFLERVFSVGERAAIGADADSAAVGFAVKECLIKALGGRPDPFSWHDLETDLRLAGPLDADLHRLVANAALPFVRAMGVTRVLAAPCALTRSARRAALLRLCAEDRDNPVGMAMWGWTGRLVTAVAVAAIDKRTDRRRADVVTG